MLFSNFTTVISASDGSLWVIGLGEGDRNCVITPVQVQYKPPPGSIYLDDENDPISEEHSEGDPPREPADPSVTDTRPEPEYYVASLSSTVLRKGHQRVIVLEDAGNNTHNSPDSASVSCLTKVYEVILHNYEAFLLPVPIDFDPSCEPPVGQRYRVKDYSTGWMHTVTLIETVGE